MKSQEATIASLQCSMGQLSKERDTAVKALDVLRVKGSKQRESLEQCRAEQETEMRACKDRLGQLNKTRQQVRQNGCGMLHALLILLTSSCVQYVSLREALFKALGMTQGQASDDQALIETAEHLFLALRRQEQRSLDLETSLRQLEKGFLLGLQDTLAQLGKLEN